MNRQIMQDNKKLVKAFMRGDTVEFRLSKSDDQSWRTTEKLELGSNIEYRIQPACYFINWGLIDPEFKWIARDSFGYYYAYNKKPKVLKRSQKWLAERGSREECIQTVQLPDDGTYWKRSLQERPASIRYVL